MPLYRSHRSRDGGIDRIPLPAGVAGALWLCGKHAIGPDPDAVADRVGADVVVCLNERHELAERYPGYVAWLATSDRAVLWPIPDLHAPELEQGRARVAELAEQLRAGRSMIVHCGAGIGRAGTIAAAVLVELGQPLDDALAAIATARPTAGPEAGAQIEFLRALAAD